MHIVDTTLFFAPHSGGVKRYLCAKRRYLHSTPGVRHTLLVPGARVTNHAGLIEFAAPRIPFGGGYRMPLGTSRWRDALCELAPDLIEAGDPYQGAWATVAATRRLGVPAVAFAHSDLASLVASRFGAAAGMATRAYLQRLYARFDLVLAPSRVVAAHLQSLGVARVEIRPLGVDATVFHPDARDGALRTELGLAPSTRLLIYAGRLAREKRIALMRRAVEGLGPRYHLLLVGGDVRRRVSPQVTVLPYEQETRRLARLFASCDALLHAGPQETFGLVVLEAMACGVPVVGVDSGAVAELVDAEVGRLAEPDRVDALQHAIRSLYAGDRELMAVRARARVESAYTWERTLGAQLQRYARLRGSAPSTPAVLHSCAPP
ncbi:MAG: glycosyltransferase [Rhodanobacteraceae bacterium]